MSDPKSAIDDVIAGRSKHAVICGDVMDVLPLVPDASIHVSYNDPPYGLSEQNIDNIVECLRAWLDGKVYTHNRQGFMGKEWDAYVPGPEAWREVHRVLKPGAYNVSFSSTRTVDLLGMAIRLAGFELRQGWSWIQGQGFPKSLDVSKAIDERGASDVAAMRAWVKSLGTREDIASAAGVTPRQVDHWIGENTPCPQMLTGSRFAKLCEVFGNIPEWADVMFPAQREVIGKIRHARSGGDDFGKLIGSASTPKTADVTAPATEAAKQWDGYGTDVKPAYEPLVVARKEMDGTVAANVLAHGCGVLNIDAARIGGKPRSTHAAGNIRGSDMFGGGFAVGAVEEASSSGRFPAAVVGVHDEDCELVGVTKIRGDARQGGGAREGGFADTGAPRGDGVPNSAGKANADGTETVDEWRCTETCAVAELARQSGDRSSPWVGNTRGNSVGKKGGVMFGGSPQSIDSKTEYLDIGSAARFFYQAKASASDRLAYVTCSDGCAHHDSVAGVRDARATASEPTKEHPHGLCLACNAPRAHYQHPTVKPQSLANWHAKLLSLPEHVSPIAIVPYCGTGIEAKALLDAGFRVIAIDIDPRHCAMTEFRLSNGAPVEARVASDASMLPVQPKRVAAPKKPAASTAQLDLFGSTK